MTQIKNSNLKTITISGHGLKMDEWAIIDEFEILYHWQNDLGLEVFFNVKYDYDWDLYDWHVLLISDDNILIDLEYTGMYCDQFSDMPEFINHELKQQSQKPKKDRIG